ncbi:MAG: YdcH family protein [Litorimonas sp.]
MAISAHLEQLQNKHAELDKRIHNELRHPIPDTLRLAQLKKEKLRLKEQIRFMQAA